MSRISQCRPVFWLMSVLLILALMVVGFPAALAADAQGECGAELTWTLEGGTLTITGSGAMTDFTEPDMAPWYPYRNEILRLSLPEGLTSVGDLAFYQCKNLETVVLPNSVQRVGNYAFMECSGMTLLNLGSGLRTVGEAAFSDCYALRSLSLPNGLESIGMKGFYRCESITSVTIPASVTSVGISSFGYCKKLVSATVNASIAEIPEFMFYGCGMLSSVSLPPQVSFVNQFSFRGCDELNTVYYAGENMTLEELNQAIGEEVGSSEPPSGPVSGGTLTPNEDGSISSDTVTVTQGQNSSVSTTEKVTVNTDGTNTTVGEPSVDINVTVNGNDGWQEASGLLQDSLNNVENRYEGQELKPSVSVDANGTDTIDSTFVESMAGRDVTMTITTQNGSSWIIDCSEITGENASGIYDMSYTIEKGSQELCEELGVSACFVLRFAASGEINTELLIRLGDTWARQNATLFQREGGKLHSRQNVVVDSQGCAHFYLASVNAKTEYYIAMNLPVPAEEEAILPAELLAEYNMERYEPVQYVVTGRTSSWGIGVTKLTWIMVAVLCVCFVAVGTIMFLINKQKLKMGILPEIHEDDLKEKVHKKRS